MIIERPFPPFVILSGFTTMKLTKETGYYWRPAGAWGTWARWVGDELRCYYPAMEHLHDEVFTEITEEEFLKDNEGYA